MLLKAFDLQRQENPTFHVASLAALPFRKKKQNAPTMTLCLSVLKSVSASLRVQSEGLMPQGPLLPIFLSELMLRDCAVKAKRGRSSKRTSCALQLLIIGHFFWCLGLLPELVAEPCPREGLGSWDLLLPLLSARSPSECASLGPPVLQETRADVGSMMQSQVPGWDGNPGTWLDYVRRVRLEWMKTPEKKRSLLGASLASRLTGRAWEVSTELDAGKLQERKGATYLLDYLESKLGRTPVPDLGSRLEDLFIRL